MKSPTVLSFLLSGCVLSNEIYHPSICTIEKYNFAFIWNGTHHQVHGLWPDLCKECETCSYPTCCNMSIYKDFTMPIDTQFIDENWYGGESHMKINTCELTATTLFEHEVLKHASCMGLFSTDYMNTVASLYYKYLSHIENTCIPEKDCEIYLNGDFTLL